ncbi:hypothetical protein [Lutibacter citreus]|uniref:hypothetical protein n=1 Tax=Lutibacter citreus TaxID=2138210 RepID=UPI000DBE97CD|nr:hypothetical protein [Lutibacter citreus]
MKNFEITFKNGLLIDKKTGKVINLAPFNTYYIQGDDDSFIIEENKQVKAIPLSSDKKIASLQKRHKNFKLEKIGTAGDVLYYRIGLGKPSNEDIQSEFLFNAVLDEDLYIKSKDLNKWTLCKCICKTTKIIEGELGLEFQNVDADSLSELYANVVSTYFNKKRSTACNAFKTFCHAPEGQSPSLNWIKNKPNLVLDLRRNALIIKPKQKEVLAKLS